MTDKIDLIPLSELCQKLHRSESTIRRYVREYREYLIIESQKLSDGISRLAATQLSLIRDLKHARLKEEEIRRVLQGVQNEKLWSKIQNMGPELQEKRRELFEKAESLNNPIVDQDTHSNKNLKTGLQITRDTIGVLSFLMALKGYFDTKDAKKENADLRGMLEERKRNYNNDSRRILELLQEQNRDILEIKISISPLRSTSRTLSADQVKAMLKARGFFDGVMNKNARGIAHQYYKLKRRGQILVRDDATGLIWQQKGSSELKNAWENAKEYVQDLNWRAYAGYKDWRLPTLEEAMSLMERTKKNGDLYIDPIFDEKQLWIWTADKVKRASRAWVVYFVNGYCFNGNYLYNNYWVRAVRS